MIRKMSDKNIENVAGGHIFCKNGVVIENNEDWNTFLDFLKEDSNSPIKIQTPINKNSENFTKSHETIKEYSTDGHIDEPIFIRLDPNEQEAFKEYFFAT